MSEPYAEIAAFYDAEFAGVDTDTAFFSRHAAPGRLLVLGCGTGRVVRSLAGTRQVVGLDRSPAMLELAARRVPGARFVLGDMTVFDLGWFGEVLIPNAGFSFLPSRRDQAACLASCARALQPGGQLVIDVPMPDFSRLGERHTPEKLAWEGHVDGREARRTREVFRVPELQRLVLVDRYWFGDALVATSELRLRHILPGELEWMLEAAGFAVEALCGDHAGGPIRAGCPRILARAVLLG